ncbi:hypothetical protein CesoFtcFv8_017141 [Champsocephalus esox]|uniref:Uncharacterized protein n=1 Tax=Champsocephalus esox TaxID=159716 RepID=A0AAN8BK90_9TELE|nr:hypothetical protein CesoFtcFv8_017141 [Champsocephalus esox]
MDGEDFPPPPPEMLADNVPHLADEEEGETFDFDDSGDDVPEADRPPPAPLPPNSNDQNQDMTVVSPPEGHLLSPDPPAPSITPHTAPSSAEEPVDASASSTAGGAAAGGEWTSAAEEADDMETDLPPAPPPPLDDEAETDPGRTGSAGPDASLDDAHPPEGVIGSSSKGKVNPYSVIDINPFQLQQLEPQQGPSSPVEPKEREGEVLDILSTPAGITSGYSVPVPCGYATPSGVPLITPAYTTPVIIRHLSMDEDVTVVETGSTAVDSEEHPPIREEDALAKWASDPANTAWMENPDEVIYDDVPRENSDSNTDPDEMIYDDVEFGEEGGCGSSLDNGWSSSEFESYDEASDGEGRAENGLPHAFMRGKPPPEENPSL